MKTLILTLFSLLLISCSKDENTEKSNLIGTWNLVTKGEISSGDMENYPDTLGSSIQLEFSMDSVIFYGCEMFLGSGKYILAENYKLIIEGFTYIEPCSLNGWVEIVANNIIHSSSYNIHEDTLKIMTEKNGGYFLKFKKD